MKTILYWVSTLMLSAFMLFVAFAYLTHQPKMMAAFTSLGYPSYFPDILGVAKILGVIALLVPGFPRLKEWAYAGFTFTFIGAFISHLAVGQNQEALMPLVALGLLAISYFTSPASRMFPAPFAIGSRTTVVKTMPQKHVTV
jgi:hypothetical protein